LVGNASVNSADRRSFERTINYPTWADFRTLHDHLTDLQHGLYIRVVGYVASDLLRMRAAGCLEGFDRSADEVALGHVNRLDTL